MSAWDHRLAFLSHPYHRGGVTRWMIDAAACHVASGSPCWFVVPTPSEPFVNGADRPQLLDLINALPNGQRPTSVMPAVGAEFEFGTAGYRSRVYARAIQKGVPAGVPIIVSDDPSAWRAVEMLDGRNPLVGVLHADDARYYALVARYRRTASAIVAVSNRILARAMELLQRSPVTTAVIPCGIPLPPAAIEAEAQRPGSRLVWVGRISETQKRVSDLARIARLLRDAGTVFHLDIVGDGDAATALRADVESGGMADRVTFHGWLPSPGVLTILRRSDVMLLPSNFEGMPVAAMEALASGCVVVGSDRCGLEEYEHLTVSRNALWIYPLGNVGEAVRAIHAALETPPQLRRASARRLGEREFSIAGCLGRYEQLLHRIPERQAVESSIASWHPADVVSRWVAVARRWRVGMSRHLTRGQRSHRIRAAAA